MTDKITMHNIVFFKIKPPGSIHCICRKILFSMSIIWILFFPVHAQESSVSINHEGKDFTMLKHAWKAQWITHPTASTLDYGVFNFRGTLNLEKKPEKFIVYVSADNRYRLYVNGRYICMGPSRGDLTHWRYETLDIAPYLTAGKNVLAAEVVNFGEHRPAAQQTFQTAFILQSDSSNDKIINTGDDHWKVIKNEAFKAIPFSSADLHGYYAAGPGDRLDMSGYPWGWQNPDFDDHDWLQPRPATVEFAVGRGFLYGSTWFLVPRSIPLPEETPQRIVRLARAQNLNADDGFLTGKAPLIIPPASKVTLLLDQTHHTIGYPELRVSRGKNSTIRITYAEALYDSAWKKGNRNDLRNKRILGYYDIVKPDGGINRLYKPLAQRTYRFIQFDIETKAEPLEILDYHGVYTAYPFREKAAFETGDPMLQKIWDASWLTLRNSAVETFLDPYYEQLQYIGDTRIEALISIYVSGDDRLMRKAIELFDQSRLPFGLTQSRYPAYIVQVIPPFSLLWIDMVHDYYLYRGDDPFVEKFLPGISDVLEWFERHIDRTGMPTGLEWWNFTDWSPGFKNGIPPGADNGYSALISLQYVMAARFAAELFSHFGWKYEAEKYSRSADRVRKSVYDHCYVPSKGLFAETPHKKLFSQHTQIMAILTDAIPSVDQAALMQKTLKDGNLIPVMIYFRFYLFRALQKSGLGNEYLHLLGPWKRMIDLGLTTFAEKDTEPRSECHAWSASPCFDFLHTVAGIRPGSPGFKTVIIEPNPGDLRSLHATFPHPSGTIEISMARKEGDKTSFTVTMPDNAPGKLIWKGDSRKLSSGTQKFEFR